MEVSVQLRRKLRGVTEKTLSGFAVRACKAARLRGDLGIVVIDDGEMRAMNRRFRGKNRTTDVLSFPSAVKGYAGDIAISADVATSNAKRFGHSLPDELKVLILHGILHLAGYDHEIDDGAMKKQESALRESLGLPVSLIERSERGSSKQRASRAKPVPRKQAASSR